MLDATWTCMCVKFQLYNLDNAPDILKIRLKYTEIKKGRNSCKNKKNKNPRQRLFYIH